MKREEIVYKIKRYIKELKDLGVNEIIISRECLLEGTIESTIPIIVKSANDNYESYNAIQEFLNRHISELLEVIPSDSFIANIDDHFDESCITIKFYEEKL